MTLWPRRGSLLEWLLCTASWGLRAGGEDRNYAHFALGELAALGQRAQVTALIRRLVATPPRDVVFHVMECTAIAEAWLMLDDEAAARATFDALTPLAERAKRKSDAAFLRDALGVFCVEHGLSSADERAALTADQRVTAECALARAALRRGSVRNAHLHARAAAAATRGLGWGPTMAVVSVLLAVKAPNEARAAWRRLSPGDRAHTDVDTLLALGLRAQALTMVKARAATALKQLVPDEWNVHRLVEQLTTAVSELTQLKQPKQADALLTTLTERLAAGALDGRGFASAQAYVSLAQVVGRARVWAQAEPLLERALAMKGARRDLLPAVVDAARALGRIEEALRWAAELRAPQRDETVAELLFRAGRRKELALVLARIKKPETAARLSWSFASHLLGR